MPTIEIIGLIAATLTTGAFVPQVYKAWRYKSTKDVSMTMYIVLLVGVLLWLFYGIKINSLSIILANVVTTVFIVIIIVLKLRHK
jgi:MtN3 and saliva related transmembrane protein